MLVTSALPYANGALHLGHLVEYVQTRHLGALPEAARPRLPYVCASDAHGTPIMLKARAGRHHARGADRADRRRARRATSPTSTSPSTTSTRRTRTENRELTDEIYRRAARRPATSRRETIQQAYDEQATACSCPTATCAAPARSCGAPDQYGDSCEVCGATYTPADLIDPVSVAERARAPVQRDSEHLFFQLGDFEPMLREWTGSATAADRTSTRSSAEWFARGPARLGHLARCAVLRLRDPRRAGQVLLRLARRARSATSASFLQPTASAATVSISTRTGSPDSDAEVHHFIGKDIVYFHTLFWPAVLHGAGFRTPTARATRTAF